MHSRFIASTLLFLVLLSQFGCAVTRVNTRERVQWADETVDLGRAALLVRIDHRVFERDPERKDAEVREIVHEIMNKHTVADLASESSINEFLRDEKRWQNASEYEIIEAARKAGLDMVGMVTFDRYGGDVFVYLLPPGWITSRYVYYRLRLLDVATGSIVADLSRYRRTDGYLAVTGRKDLPHDLRADLTQVLAREASAP